MSVHAAGNLTNLAESQSNTQQGYQQRLAPGSIADFGLRAITRRPAALRSAKPKKPGEVLPTANR